MYNKFTFKVRSIMAVFLSMTIWSTPSLAEHTSWPFKPCFLSYLLLCMWTELIQLLLLFVHGIFSFMANLNRLGTWIVHVHFTSCRYVIGMSGVVIRPIGDLKVDEQPGSTRRKLFDKSHDNYSLKNDFKSIKNVNKLLTTASLVIAL